MTRARVVRWVVIGVCVVGIAGMIVGSIGDDNAVALTFGLVTAAAVVSLMVATAVAPPAAESRATRDFDERRAARVEDLIQRLVDGGTPEEPLRRLVGEAVHLGQDRPSDREIPQIGAPDADY
jgi:hypothetical protein